MNSVFFARPLISMELDKLDNIQIKAPDRRSHTYIIGRTGMGKSTLLENMAVQDIQSGSGLAYIDPHGDSAKRLLNAVPKYRNKDVVYFNPADVDRPIGFNPLGSGVNEDKSLLADAIINALHKIWSDSWGARLENLLRVSCLSVMGQKDPTFLNILRILIDDGYRKRIVKIEKDPIVKMLWTEHIQKYSERFKVEANEPVINKLAAFSTIPKIRNILCQSTSSFNMREVMDKKKILIINLSKGLIGEGSMRLIGSLLITIIQQTAMSRADVAEKNRPDFYLYVDEFWNFITDSFLNILSEARKYRLNLILAHQYIEQLTENMQSSIFGNIGTLIMFRVGARDLEALKPEVEPNLAVGELLSLDKYQLCYRLQHEGITEEARKGIALPPIEPSDGGNREAIIRFSRERYGRPRDKIENKIKRWTQGTKTNTLGGVCG